MEYKPRASSCNQTLKALEQQFNNERAAYEHDITELKSEDKKTVRAKDNTIEQHKKTIRATNKTIAEKNRPSQG
ncbi:hypothetical protein E8E11_008727 [Didymella keratinophila]|nr:hypothetical protein E8E11_008727 [Didymella keratinophila]